LKTHLQLHTWPTILTGFPFSSNEKRLTDWFLVFCGVGVDVDDSDGLFFGHFNVVTQKMIAQTQCRRS
jgi:hypothetical protein